MTEGTAEFIVPGLSEPCQTWFKTIGDLTTSQTPLIIIHGGPGACHDYLLPLTDLSPSTPLIFYDQIGNGRSTHLPDKAGNEAFWSVDLFHNELDNLISHLGLKNRPIDIFGHSWGGMLAAIWAATPSSSVNLRRLVIANSLASRLRIVWRVWMLGELVSMLWLKNSRKMYKKFFAVRGKKAILKVRSMRVRWRFFIRDI